MDNSSSGLILLTYKGKVLLMHKQNSVIDQENHPWGLISCIKEKTQTFEVILAKRVQKEMGIKINNVECVSEFYYHARLTDDNVNQITRSENQLLDFFTPKEVDKLFLSSQTANFLAEHKNLI